MQSFNFHNWNGIINCWSFDDCIGRKIHVRIDSTVDRHGYHRSCYSVIRILCNLTQKKYDFFMQGEHGASLERKLSVEVSEIRDAAKGLESLLSEQVAIRNIQSNTIQKIGFIKYNAFENIGNDLSFALTLLDGNNNGICISSIYGRSESRIFSKPIVKGKSLVSLSQEELESLNEALGERTNEEALTSAIVSK